MNLNTWLIYLLAAIGLSLSPGPNGLLALTHGALHGRRKALYTIFGGAFGFIAVVALSMFGIGALLKKVVGAGLRERTIVVFQSDIGHSTEVRAHFGGGSACAYRGQKFSLFEGGLRLPAIVSWPGLLPQGEVRGQLNP